MAVPPTVPTSFGPQSFARKTSGTIDFGGAFAFVCYGAFSVVLLASLGVFVYQKFLESQLSKKNDELATAEASIDEATVQSLLALRDRLNSSMELLDNHVAFTGFFTLLEATTLKNVFLKSAQIDFNDQRVAAVTLTGTAKNINALAAQSHVFANVPGLKDAIFSGVQIGETNQISFTMNANLDKSVYIYGSTPVLTSGGATATSTNP